MIQVKIKKTDVRAVAPTYGSEGAAGADLYALLDAPLTIAPGETVMVHTGIAVELPEGYAGLVYPRSGLASKRGLAPANKVGVVDPDYRGEVMVALHNHSLKEQTIEVGERVAQLVVTPFLHVDFVEAEELSDTQRGAGGFGSTGTTVTLTHEVAAPTEEETATAPAPYDTTEASTLTAAEAAEVAANAIRYFHGIEVPFDRKRAVELLRTAAVAGDVLSRARLAYLSCIGDEVACIPRDTATGIAYLSPLLLALEELVDAGIPEAMLLWGNLLIDGLGVEKNEKRAVELYYTAAENGYAPAANALGQCYSFATGVKADDLRAVSCYRRAAEAGYAPAQFHLGVCYFNGQGVKVDKIEAAKWYVAAAEQGYAPAQFTIGKHYVQIMNGVENDPVRGEMWLNRAAEQGLVKAIVFLADLYHNRGTDEADKLAALWYIRGVECGDLYALKQLSSYYETGRGGVPRDPATAKELLRRAALSGYREAELAYRDRYGE